MAPPFTLPPPDFPMPAYVRRVESGLLIPRQAVLPGMIMPPGLIGGSLLPSIAFLSSATNTSNASTYTFSSVPFGDADPTRRIIVAAHSAGSPGRPTSSVTIRGVSATKVVEQVEDFMAVSIWIATVPSGTSGAIVISYGTTMDRAGYGAWRVVNLRSNTAKDTAVSQFSPNFNTLDLAGLSPGAVVVAACTSGGGPTFGYTGTSLDYTEAWSDTSSSNQRFAGSHGQSASGGAFPIKQTTTGGNGEIAGVSAAFR